MRWEKVKLKKIGTQIRGVSYQPTDVSQEKALGFTAIYRANNITEVGVKSDDLVYVKNERVSEKQKLQLGDILIAASSGSKHIVGRAVFINKQPHASFGAFCKVVRPIKDFVDPRYLSYFFQSPIYRRTISNLSAGANINNIRNEDIDELDVPLPPLHIQEQIADTLDKADALRRKDQELLKKYDQLAQSIFYDMFGDPVKNEKGWEIRTLDELSLKVADIDHNMPKAVEKGVPFISAKDLIDDGKISFDSVKYISEADYARLSRKVKPEYGDILYSRIGAKLGKARKVTTKERFLVSYSCCTIKPNTNVVNTDYLCSFLDSPFCLQEVFKKVRSIGVPDLGMDEVRNINVPYPELKLQEIYANKISTIKLCKEKVLNNKSINLFNALNVDYFS